MEPTNNGKPWLIGIKVVVARPMGYSKRLGLEVGDELEYISLGGYPYFKGDKFDNEPVCWSEVDLISLPDDKPECFGVQACGNQPCAECASGSEKGGCKCVASPECSFYTECRALLSGDKATQPTPRVKVGDEVLVIGGANAQYALGELVTVKEVQRQAGAPKKAFIFCEGRTWGLMHHKYLAVGDRVRRGPDWDWQEQDGGAGKLGTITKVAAHDEDCNVSVKWDCGFSEEYEMAAHKQDLELVLDEPKEEGGATRILRERAEYKEKLTIQEDTMDACKGSAMTREEQAKELDTEVRRCKGRVKEMNAEIKAKQAQAVDLRAHETDRDEEIALYIDATGATKKKAEAYFKLRDKGITV